MNRINKSEKTKSIDFAFSRRGFFAALATLAGLGFIETLPKQASALANPGIWLGGYWGGTDNRLTHNNRTQGVGDSWFGQVNNPIDWDVHAGWNERLSYAFGMVYECDYSNELYDHLVFLPYFYCSSYDSNGVALWKGNYDGDDNRISCRVANVEVGATSGNLINEGSYTTSWNNGWRQHDLYQSGYYDHWVRREKDEKKRSVSAKCELFNIYANIEGESWEHRQNGYGWYPDICGPLTQWAPGDNSRNIITSKIYLENDVSLYGGIFKLHPVTHPDKHLDLIQGGKENGIPVVNYENSRSVVIWDNYDGINALWVFKPFNSDGLGTFTFAIANLAGPGLIHDLNNEGHDTPKTDGNHNVLSSVANIWKLGEGSPITKSWWVTHEPSASNETDHKCWFLTSDGDGQRLNLNGSDATNGRQLGINCYAKPGEWAGQTDAQWNIVEARCHGYVKNSKKTAIIGDNVTCIGFMPDSDETPTLQPSGWLHNVTNRKELPPQPIYRWYVTRDLVDVPDDDNAVIMAHCWVSTWGNGPQTEAPSHRHIGYPHGGHSIFNLSLHLEGSQFDGSICYAARAYDSSSWVTGRDGEEICGSPIAEVKIWLMGEIAENYDLCYRSIPLNGKWTDTVYSCGHADNDGTAAPACGNTGSAKMCGLNVHLIRKPRGARVVKEFSFDDTIEIKEDISQIDDAVWLWSAAMMGITTLPADEQRVWTDRMLGTVVVGTGLPKTEGIPANPPTRLQSTVHFMLVDTLGDTQEVHTVYIKLNTEYRASEHEADFSDARAALEQVMRDEGQDMSLLDRCLDGWYEGDDLCSDSSIFQGLKYVGRKVNGDLYLWSKVTVCKFRFYKDGLAKENLIFESPRMLVGTHYIFPQEVTDKQLEPTCNLNDRFGIDPSTGFTGWHLDKTLSDQAITEHVAIEGIVILYGRNRCTLRTEYAPGSVVLDPSWDMRLLPEVGAEVHPGFIPTFDEPKHKGYDAKGNEFELAAIGDSGDGHTAYYWDELARITIPATAYRDIGGGQWRTYRCEAWLDADEANAAAETSESGVSLQSRSRARAASAVKMTADTVRYIRWTEVVSDGVVGVRRK